ncbi:MAG: ABC transporter ATP-binding protein [Treponema sp.]|jgi:peptide/nickel transport system ATP-binding protein|nr:ABC transporter ATP-binding protein [Treponema sp.]
MDKERELLRIEDLVIRYVTDDGVVEALNGVSLFLREKHTLGLVGETGAGKTTLARGIMGLIPNPPGEILSGRILFEGEDLLKLGEVKMRAVRGNQISMIFQDPMTSLNPVMTVGEQIMEVIRTHNKLSPKETLAMARDMLETVGISADRMGEYPHQFSGGMKQRVIIAIALACKPKLLIADEPTTALDVTIQAQVLEMIRSLKSKLNTSMLLITHDLGVVAQHCDHVAIIYAGEIVEYGSLRDIFKRPKHPYTQGLLGSIPSLVRNVTRLKSIKGLMPDPVNLPRGCKFHSRCNYAGESCIAARPPLTDVGEEHLVRCVYARDGFPAAGTTRGDGY